MQLCSYPIYSAVLCCAVLCCAVLCCAVLCCAVLTGYGLWALCIAPQRNEKTPNAVRSGFLGIRCLAMPYSHMGRPHTTIGEAAFHC